MEQKYQRLSVKDVSKSYNISESLAKDYVSKTRDMYVDVLKTHTYKEAAQMLGTTEGALRYAAKKAGFSKQKYSESILNSREKQEAQSWENWANQYSAPQSAHVTPAKTEAIDPKRVTSRVPLEAAFNAPKQTEAINYKRITARVPLELAVRPAAERMTPARIDYDSENELPKGFSYRTEPEQGVISKFFNNLAEKAVPYAIATAASLAVMAGTIFYTGCSRGKNVDQEKNIPKAEKLVSVNKETSKVAQTNEPKKIVSESKTSELRFVDLDTNNDGRKDRTEIYDRENKLIGTSDSPINLAPYVPTNPVAVVKTPIVQKQEPNYVAPTNTPKKVEAPKQVKIKNKPKEKPKAAVKKQEQKLAVTDKLLAEEMNDAKKDMKDFKDGKYDSVINTNAPSTNAVATLSSTNYVSSMPYLANVRDRSAVVDSRGYVAFDKTLDGFTEHFSDIGADVKEKASKWGWTDGRTSERAKRAGHRFGQVGSNLGYFLTLGQTCDPDSTVGKDGKKGNGFLRWLGAPFKAVFNTIGGAVDVVDLPAGGTVDLTLGTAGSTVKNTLELAGDTADLGIGAVTLPIQGIERTVFDDSYLAKSLNSTVGTATRFARNVATFEAARNGNFDDKGRDKGVIGPTLELLTDYALVINSATKKSDKKDSNKDNGNGNENGSGNGGSGESGTTQSGTGGNNGGNNGGVNPGDVSPSVPGETAPANPSGTPTIPSVTDPTNPSGTPTIPPEVPPIAP